MLGSLQNFIGWDGASNITNEGEHVLPCIYALLLAFKISLQFWLPG